ncbi:MAG: hypothetical protein L6Q98_09420 [Anaerolineae bacterium]|nr:hypothetical protein [Anaerolineae bacterium]NUQ06609.1 hypothetical protein [Anaerolineae bacterium]
MPVVICKVGETQPGTVTVTLEREATTQIIDAADAAMHVGVQVEIRTFQAA